MKERAPSTKNTPTWACLSCLAREGQGKYCQTRKTRLHGVFTCLVERKGAEHERQAQVGVFFAFDRGGGCQTRKTRLHGVLTCLVAVEDADHEGHAQMGVFFAFDRGGTPRHVKHAHTAGFTCLGEGKGVLGTGILSRNRAWPQGQNMPCAPTNHPCPIDFRDGA